MACQSVEMSRICLYCSKAFRTILGGIGTRRRSNVLNQVCRNVHLKLTGVRNPVFNLSMLPKYVDAMSKRQPWMPLLELSVSEVKSCLRPMPKSVEASLEDRYPHLDKTRLFLRWYGLGSLSHTNSTLRSQSLHFFERYVFSNQRTKRAQIATSSLLVTGQNFTLDILVFSEIITLKNSKWAKPCPVSP